MRYEFTSSAAAMAANGNLSEITPWRLIIDTDEQTITVSKRNKFLIGTDAETLAFRFVRRVEINEHLIGADITIQAVGGKLTARSMAKSDCRRIKQILMDQNKKSKTKSKISIKAPIKPNSSHIIEKIKSLCGSGIYKIFCLDSPRPKPVIPPAPRA